ncbi:MAG: c-type cytochrome [Deltaproteobacteria bacterium]|nr:c-type cytochrome [Deltaproteobacteria bacterium]
MKKIKALVLCLGMGLLCAAAGARGGEAGKGADLYVRYCGSCHGVEAKGDGPVSKHLSIRPPDLTQLRKKNKGVFPLEQVMSAIDGTRAVRTHGDSKMPVWGEVFEKFDRARKDPEQAQIKVKVIAEQLSTLQR